MTAPALSLHPRTDPPAEGRRPVAAGTLGHIEGTRSNIGAKPQLHRASDEQLLALVVAGREARRGEAWELAKEAWRHLAARHYDRVRGLVVTFSFPGNQQVQIAPSEYD